MSSTKDSVVETIKTIVYALLIAGIFRTFFFQPFFIPSSSMKDTLLIGDFLFVNKMSYGYSKWSCPMAFMCPVSGRILFTEPERGDIVVFEHPTKHVTYVKRLIGLPGDQVQLKDGVVFINGEEAVQTPDGVFVETFEPQGAAGNPPRCANPAPGLGGDCVKEKFIETLPGGRQHSVLNAAVTGVDNTNVYTVPEGQYFFMGDNRDNSVDSRIAQPSGVGFVPAEYLLGRVDRVIFSSAGKHLVYFWTWRKDRFFKGLQ
ncbi:signal peptidase I . Serine peptidase. MEROPS family S26A [Celeribacter baekdonensis]|uniref:Signal peptidase I n=1 Tax=Celeribacter baekdonensis TaxID=875171 RepID=A0A1G7NAT5_9RHOB|nr:signal peptidase I [Celeribacter baekdonensis]SDF71072.1 signal peptidase I . Serine peptidase. MEROPS family S26A [Celeribacter baekdonensis]